MLYDIKRNGYTIATVYPEGSQVKEIMLRDEVPITFSSRDALHFQHGDYIEVYGEIYYLNQLDEPTKNSTFDYKYSLTFQAAYYSLAKPKILSYDTNNLLKVITFEMMANASSFLDLIIANANRTQSGWVKGDVDLTEAQLLAFDGESVLTAIDQVAKAFDTEWWVVNKVIHLKKRGVISGYKFEYGYNKGLRGGLTRTNVDSSGVFSRLYVTGSNKNISSTYRSGQVNLMLPDPMDYIQGPKYGNDEIEEVINFPDIQPEYIGTISSVGDKFNFTDTGIDFNINDQLIDGLSAKVSFLTGQLSGYTFEIAKGGYNATTKTVTIVTNEAEKAYILPSDLMKPEVGDTYLFFDLKMPDTYIQDAENRLLVKGQDYFNTKSVPQVAYDVPPDNFFFKRNNIVLNLGDYVHVQDFDLRLNKDIRINSYERDLHDPFKYSTLQISDLAIGSPFINQIAEAEKLNKAIAISKINDIQRSRSNWKTTNELTTLLNTVKAEMLLIMVDGGAYTTDIIATTTPTHFQTTGGTIYHEQYDENKGIWNVSVFAIDLVAAGPFYVYIKASRSSQDANIILSESKIAVESDPAFYYFPFGVISTLIEGQRFFSSIRGYTKVTGDVINTGRIVSNNGLNYFDLSAGTFNLGTDLSGMDFGVTESGQLTIRGQIVATDAEFVNLIVGGFTVNSDGLIKGNPTGLNQQYVNINPGSFTYRTIGSDPMYIAEMSFNNNPGQSGATTNIVNNNNSLSNTALRVTALNGSSYNVAIDATGTVIMNSAQCIDISTHTDGYEVAADDYLVIMTGGASLGVFYLPSLNKLRGRTIVFKNNSGLTKVINGNGSNIGSVSTVQLTTGQSLTFTFDSSAWNSY